MPPAAFAVPKAGDNLDVLPRRVMEEVRRGADAIAGASSRIAAGNADLPSRTEKQLSSLAETAAANSPMPSAEPLRQPSLALPG